MTPLLLEKSESLVHSTAAVLVVDDDATVLDALCAQLACDGWEVTGCCNAADALSALRVKRYAAIISDQNMPEMKGLEFLTLAREIQPAASRLLITGILNAGTLIQAINHGEIYRFLSKPWTRAELLVCVRNAVQRYELALANEKLLAEVETLRSDLVATQGALTTARSLLPGAISDIKAHDARLNLAMIETLTPAVAHRLQEPSAPVPRDAVLAAYC